MEVGSAQTQTPTLSRPSMHSTIEALRNKVDHALLEISSSKDGS